MDELLLTSEEIIQNRNRYYFASASELTRNVAKAQLAKCEKEAKPVWQREAVEMVFKRIKLLDIRGVVDELDGIIEDELCRGNDTDIDSCTLQPLRTLEVKLQSLEQELLDEIGGEK